MYIGTSVNESPVIAYAVGAEIVKGAFRAVKLVNGKVQLASAAGEKVIGLLPAQTPEKLVVGDDVTVQLTARGKWLAGGAIEAGAEVATNENGQAVTAVMGNAVVGIALSSAAGAGSIIDVMITNAGQKA